jgi:hypothetical protein
MPVGWTRSRVGGQISEHVIDAAYLRRQATKCRYLARFSHAREARILNNTADDYEAKARALDAAGSPDL